MLLESLRGAPGSLWSLPARSCSSGCLQLWLSTLPRQQKHNGPVSTVNIHTKEALRTPEGALHVFVAIADVCSGVGEGLPR